LVTLPQSAQADVTTDHQLWLSAGIQTSIVDRLDAQFVQQYRTINQGQDGQRIIPGLSLNYDIAKPVNVGVGARYSFISPPEGDSSRTLRWHSDLSLISPDLGPVRLDYRFRFQNESEPKTNPSMKRIRNRLRLRIDTSTAIRPEVFYEHYLDPFEASGHKVQKVRVGAGLGVKLNKNHRLKFRFFQDKEIDGDGDKNRIAAVGYHYKL
jgi:hypothetical protein